ncbi:MAG: bifunctional UDP-N-acetylglucosamine diphosphorylase/glucosamine-1-phosphate N-acetyltransferase GlmU [Methylovulum sp.]|jgi:bifunctional UDP-N-acetylglucosamine pyrophosphorylase/glucosamine-1-phosphate N-acetyltransferase
MTKILTLILAAGKGTRMHSQLPKVLHKLAEKPLLQHVYDRCAELENNTITIVYGHGGDLVKDTLSHLNVNWIEQKQQLGTGHAVLQAYDAINNDDVVLILYGDVPLISQLSLRGLLATVNETTLSLLTVNLENPSGYGRIVRNQHGQVIRIVEEKDASPEQKTLHEVNTGIFAVQGGQLKKWLIQLSTDNAQQEYYLTDIIAMAVEEGCVIEVNQPECVQEVLGVNDRVQLSELERFYQITQAKALMKSGVSLKDPQRFDLRGIIKRLGTDIEIDVNVVLSGEISIGNNVSIGANTHISNSVIGDNVQILPNCIIENAIIGKFSRIGPFARIRPDTVLSDHVHIGNFVEIKKTTVGASSKINHLSYIGDACVGSNVNIGAGTITCNYDGVNKFETVIGDGAFIGSDTQLIAPVKVGAYATIGAGSTITKETPEHQLTLSRSKQVSVSGWQRPLKKT